jgi:hypothetical protein
VVADYEALLSFRRPANPPSALDAVGSGGNGWPAHAMPAPPPPLASPLSEAPAPPKPASARRRLTSAGVVARGGLPPTAFRAPGPLPPPSSAQSLAALAEALAASGATAEAVRSAVGRAASKGAAPLRPGAEDLVRAAARAAIPLAVVAGESARGLMLVCSVEKGASEWFQLSTSVLNLCFFGRRFN